MSKITEFSQSVISELLATTKKSVVTVSIEEKTNDLLNDVKNIILIHGENHTALANKYHEIGSFHVRNNELLQASKYLEKAYAIREDQLGAIHEDTLDTRYMLGQLFVGDLELSRSHLQRSLELRFELDMSSELLEGRPYVVDGTEFDNYVSSISVTENMLDSTLIYCDFGESCKQNGNFSDAERWYERCISFRRKKFGAETIAISQVMVLMGDMYRVAGFLDLAHDTMETALEITTKCLGGEHRYVVDILNSIAVISRLQNRLDMAEETFIHCLGLQKKLFGNNHISVARTLNNLAELYREKSDFISSVQYSETAVELFLEVVRTIYILHVYCICMHVLVFVCTIVYVIF